VSEKRVCVSLDDDIVARELEEEDLPRLLEIAVAAWAPVFASFRELLGDDIFQDVYPDWQTEKKRQIAEASKYGEHFYFRVVEKHGKVVGFITFSTNVAAGIGEISNNAVDPDYQGLGIGTRMYKYALSELKRLGMKCAQVGTGGDAAHVAARKAYEKAGFSASIPSVQYYCKL
jgi:ribosomal protein S18 acetylase RimI-like enzyme